MRLLEPLPGVRRVDRERVVLGAAADDHPGDQAPAAQAVDDRELLGDPGRRVVERQRVADHRDFDAAGQPGHDRGHQVRGRHQPVRVLVVLVDADPVEAELLGVDELVEVAVVEGAAVLGVEQRVRAGHPRRALVGGVEPDVGHQVKREEPHGVHLPVGADPNGRRARPVRWARHRPRRRPGPGPDRRAGGSEPCARKPGGPPPSRWPRCDSPGVRPGPGAAPPVAPR